MKTRSAPALARCAALAALVAAWSPQALADFFDVEILHRQTGGIFADGGLNNHHGFQNYFVGYGTSPGLPRTAERRSFFIFDLPALPPGFVLAGARIELKLPFGGLIFGVGPGSPGVDPIEPDATETFQLGLLPVASSIVTSPSLTPAEGMRLFSLMDDLPAAAAFVFDGASPLPGEPDGSAVTIPIPLSPIGLAAVTSSLGGEIVFSGWMPSWSEDFRLSPTPPPLYLEANELIFGLTDIHVLPSLAPKLVLTLAPIPAPPAAWTLTGGLIVLAAIGRRRAARAVTPG